MNKRFFIVLAIIMVFFGCNDEDKVAKEVAKIDLDLRISRFDREFAAAKSDDIPKLRKKYPYLFPAPDSVWVKKLQDSIQIELFQEVRTTFSDFSVERADMEMLFKHIKYYFPRFSTPHVITMTNNVDYNNRIILADSLVLIGLDNYLGEGHKYYEGLQRYIASGMEKDFLISDIASAFAKGVVPSAKERSFLARMIYFGKELYLKDKLMPDVSDAKKIGYTQPQFDWALANEEPIWRNFIEQEHLYSTDNQLNLRFLDPAPFSKFGLELDNESPGRLGRYIGWQIVRSYMDNNNGVSLQQMLTIPAEELFKKSNYKPRN